MTKEEIDQLAKEHYNKFYGELRSPIENIEFSIKTEAYAIGYSKSLEQTQPLKDEITELKK